MRICNSTLRHAVYSSTTGVGIRRMPYYCRMTQPSFGQPNYNPNPYSQPPAPAPYPPTPPTTPAAGSSAPSPYPVAPPAPPTTPPAVGFQGYPGGYQQPSSPGVPSEATKPKPSPMLGVISVLLILVCGTVYYIGCYSLYDTLVTTFGTGILENSDMTQFMNLSSEDLAKVRVPFTIIGLSSLGGIVGLVLSIIATIKNRGRIFGIIGIILGVIAPFTIIVAAAIVMLNYGI